tara:strand:+ start:8657 stop:9844 length:1188 start_codon:yes stop_codon:yes gene_type:complete
MDKIIPYGKHYIDDDDIESVIDVLKHKNLTQGKEIQSFEQAVADFVGAKYAVAMSSWTAGLHMACLAAGVTKGDKVITSPITFVATANAAFYCNARPLFSDIDSETINIDHQSLGTLAEGNTNIKAIIPVHYGGLACNMKEIQNIAKKRNAIVIEDAAHALGAKYKDGSMVGNCKYSDMTGFSFHPVKSIAAGEGGMITTNNYKIYKKLLRLRSHGINKLDDKFKSEELAYTREVKNPWYYEMQELGYNYRITDIQCALGQSQLKKLPLFLDRRRQLAVQYDKAFKNFDGIEPIQTSYRDISSHHLYVLRINYADFGTSRALLMNALKEKNILTQVHYLPVTSQPYYTDLGYKTDQFPKAFKFYQEALSIPMYFSLSDDDQKKVIELIKENLNIN